MRAQKRKLAGKTTREYRRLLALTLGFCLLLADALGWPWGIGDSVTVFAWYILLPASLGREAMFRRRESRVLLAANLALAASFALTSNPFFRWWNFLALAVLVPVHAMAGLSGRSWWDPRMPAERFGLLFRGLFGNLWAAFAAAAPERRTDGRRTLTIVLGTCGAVALVSILLPVLISADALFAASMKQLQWNALVNIRLDRIFRRLFWALVFTPFVFGLLYSLGNPKLLCPAKEETGIRLDALGFTLTLAAAAALYLAFLAVQSGGLFGGPEYLARRGISYAEWARSGFFQMTGVTVVNLSLILAALGLSRREGRDWTVLRALCGLVAGESLVLLASAAWRMTLYVSAYGLSFKRCMTCWGMGMMALFLLAGLWKAWKPDFRFCKWAFPLALAGWLAVNCVPVDYLVAKNQVDRYLAGEAAGETPSISMGYLMDGLSYDTLHQLARLDSGILFTDWRTGEEAPLGELLERRRSEARAECAGWRGWTLSACLAAGGSA